MLSIVIVGLGYVGVTSAACLSSQGHQVVGVDLNEPKVAAILSGKSPISEPGVDELIATASESGLLSAQVTMPPMTDVDIVVVCVGTPSSADGSHNMQFILNSVSSVARAIEFAQRTAPVTVVFRSTFRPGVMEDLIAPIFRDILGTRMEQSVTLVYNPEFLRESSAIYDYHNPPKIVIGVSDGVIPGALDEMFAGISAPTFVTGYREAELTKFVDNSWHAAKIAFANEIGRVCQAHEVDATVIHDIFVADTKLNISPYYLRPGNPFGGSCLPKDVRALSHLGSQAGVSLPMIDSLLPSNTSHSRFQLSRVLESAPHEGCLILVLGIAFKAGTDDLRESPYVDLVASLIEAGFNVSVYDPWVTTSALIGQNLSDVFSRLPRFREVLIDRTVAEGKLFDLVVVNSSVGEIDLQPTNVLDLRSFKPAPAVAG